jgi:hypothetical protein
MVRYQHSALGEHLEVDTAGWESVPTAILVWLAANFGASGPVESLEDWNRG